MVSRYNFPPMSFVPEALRGTLADRYSLDRELGQGGMATVYLARDLKHGRDVAVKVLRPELAALVGRERFLTEITTTAKLRHPHILPLYDSGEAGGFLFYVMPVIEGESLRVRLAREKQLPLEDALRIAGEVAEALAYAHDQGIVHRDIKPENILLERGHAIVADFGIAHAASVEGTERLTETGMSLGTPLYMSPEQVAGARDIDARSDLYSLGCVLYEMLAGEPPFTGPTAHIIAARRLTDPVPSVTALRESVSPAVAQALARAMAKTPADRFRTASEFRAALTGDSAAGQRWPALRLSIPIRALAALGLVVAAVAAVMLWSRNRAPVNVVDPNLIAVFPFRLTGTDTTHATLRDGMVDLFETIFSGEGGPRVLSSRTALAAWRHATTAANEEPSDEAAAKLARGLGAGSLVLGTVVATPGHLSIRATLLDAKTGAVRAEAKVEGLPDSLEALGDALADRLVASTYGMKPDRLAKLATSSLAALYAYLQGRAVYRTGNYDSAMKLFDHAIELDSSFALAAIGYGQAGAWGDWGPHFRRLELARKHQDRLSTRDRMMLTALTFGGSPRAQIDTLRRAVERVPDDPDLWTQLGDKYFHGGALAGVNRANDSAAWALERAMALDTLPNVEPTIHLIQIAEAQRDTARIRLLLNRFPDQHDKDLLVGVALHDTAMIALAKRNIEKGPGWAYMIMMDAQLFGIGLEEAEWALPLWLSNAKTRDDSLDHFGYDAFALYQNLGRPAVARSYWERLGPLETMPWQVTGIAMDYWLWGEGDSTLARQVATAVARITDAPLGAEANQYKAICLMEHWRLMHGDTATARSGIARLDGGRAQGCDVLLRALFAAVAHAPDSTEMLEALERQMAPGSEQWWRNFDLARLWEARGNLPAALRAIRRRPGYPYPGLFLRSYALREEGRLAALTGDREGAIWAYSQYLALRYNPEPSVKPAVDSVRAELARLVGEP